MKAQSVLETIGNTPHLRLSRLFPDHEVWAPLVAELDYELTIIRDYEQLECKPLGSLPLPGKPECFAKGLSNSQIALMAQIVDLERDCNTKRLKAIRYGNAHPQGRDPVVRVSCSSPSEAQQAMEAMAAEQERVGLGPFPRQLRGAARRRGRSNRDRSRACHASKSGRTKLVTVCWRLLARTTMVGTD